jgi:DNA-directed RNA polymerase specialized sigma24 family protein
VPGEHVKTGKTASRFRTTSWTLIARARDNDADLEALLERYWSPVYAYLRRKHHQPHDAADLTQAFLTNVVLERDLIARADATRGRFRAFILAALNRFLINEHRREHGRSTKRQRMFVPTDPAVLERAEPRASDEPGHAFDRQWATTILDEALRRARTTCLADGLDRQWTAFEQRRLHVYLHGGEPKSAEDVAVELGARDSQEVHNMVQTVQRRMHRELLELIAETVEDPADVAQELDDLRGFLASGPA